MESFSEAISKPLTSSSFSEGNYCILLMSLPILVCLVWRVRCWGNLSVFFFLFYFCLISLRLVLCLFTCLVWFLVKFRPTLNREGHSFVACCPSISSTAHIL